MIEKNIDLHLNESIVNSAAGKFEYLLVICEFLLFRIVPSLDGTATKRSITQRLRHKT